MSTKWNRNRKMEPEWNMESEWKRIGNKMERIRLTNKEMGNKMDVGGEPNDDRRNERIKKNSWIFQ